MSRNKINKLKNAFLDKGALKNQRHKKKRLLFYTNSQRYYDKKQSLKIASNE